jgi:hypothetical protein
MPVPSQGHYGFHSFPVVDCKIVRNSVILLLPLFSCLCYVLCFVCICSVFCTQFVYLSGFSILIDPSIFYSYWPFGFLFLLTLRFSILIDPSVFYSYWPFGFLFLLTLRFSILIDPSVFYNVYFEIQQNNSLITVSLCQPFRCEVSDIIWIVSECVIAI